MNGGMALKARRRRIILEIIAGKRISTQEELRDELVRAGYEVTQATVSRDIKDLQLIKLPDPDGYHYALPDQPVVNYSNNRLQRVFQDSVVKVDYSENIIVVKTLPGAAQSVASVLDAWGKPEILGSVGGDDTVMVVVKPKEAVTDIMDEILALF